MLKKDKAWFDRHFAEDDILRSYTKKETNQTYKIFSKYYNSECIRHFFKGRDVSSIYATIKKLQNTNKYFHDHTAPILEVFLVQDDVEICTCVLEEFVPGKTIKEILDDKADGNEPMLAEGDVLRYGVQICDTLRILHSAGIVHCDIKPSNLMIQGDICYLLDFDVSKFIDGQQSGTSFIGGSDRYAPDELADDKAVPASDIYSLGVTLHEMLVGEKRQKEIQPDRLGGVVPFYACHSELTYKGRFRKVLVKASQKQINKRYPNALKMKKALIKSRIIKRIWIWFVIALFITIVVSGIIQSISKNRNNEEALNSSTTSIVTTSNLEQEVHEIDNDVIKKNFVNILGLDGFYIEKTDALGFSQRTYYTGRDNPELATEIASSFGYCGIDDYSLDIDGDGLTELLCNNIYGGDGVQSLTVYKVFPTGILCGVIPPSEALFPGISSTSSPDFQTKYNPVSNDIEVNYHHDGMDEQIHLPFSELFFASDDDTEFEEHINNEITSCNAFEEEPNDCIADSQTIEFGVTYTGAITDSWDFFSFEATKDTELEICLTFNFLDDDWLNDMRYLSICLDSGRAMHSSYGRSGEDVFECKVYQDGKHYIEIMYNAGILLSEPIEYELTVNLLPSE